MSGSAPIGTGRRWPLVGRSSELHAAVAAVQRRGLFVVGEMGVGKSRLLSEVAEALSRDDRELIRVAGFDAAGSLPLAPLLPVLAEGADAADPARRILSELYRRTRHGRVVLVVDDAHLLDPASAGVIHQVVSNDLAPVLVAVRAPEPRPAAIDALWRDEHLERIELAPLNRPEADELVERSLGDPVDPATLARIWALTRGYPLYLRELLTGAVETGTLERDGDNRWCLTADARLPERLEEVVGERLRDLDADQRAVMEFVSLAPGLELRTVEELTSPDALRALLERNILAVRGGAGRGSVEPAHPIFAEVTAGSMTGAQLDLRRRLLGAALAGTPGSAARAACLLLDAGEPLAPELLTRAMGEARTSVDPDVLERLASKAAESSGDVWAMVARAEALAMQHRADERDHQFEQALAAAQSSEQTAIKLRWMMSVHDFDTAVGSEDFWADVVDSGPTEDPAVEEMLLRAKLFLDPPNAAHVAERCRRLRGHPDASGQLRARAQMMEATALMWAARPAEAFEVLGSAPLDELEPLDAARLEFIRIWAVAWTGQLAEADAEAGQWMVEAGNSDDADLAELAMNVGGFVATFTGHSQEAVRLFEASLRLQPVCCDVRAAPVAACLRAMHLPEVSGVDATDVTEALRAAEELPETALRLPGAALAVARSRLDRLSGRGDGVGPLMSVREEMEHRPGQLFDLYVLAELVLVGHGEVALEPLRRLGEPAGVIGWWSRAAAMVDAAEAGDLESLALVASRKGATAMAADFAALANRVHVQLGDTVGALRTRRMHVHLRERLAGTRSLVGVSASPLSDREEEVVDLVLAGHTNRRIAEELFVSERTVEGHLHRTYRKLGLDGREELARLAVPRTI